MQGIASVLAAQGRGEDSMLVHMTPKEVHALQGLAAIQGNSLTVNPHTGLPEAGILGNFLPMLAGAASEFFFPGNPWGAAMVGGAVGGIQASNNGGNVLGGALGGALGGYGGASLVGGLTGAAGDAALSSAGAAQAAVPLSEFGGAIPSYGTTTADLVATAAPSAQTAADLSAFANNSPTAFSAAPVATPAELAVAPSTAENLAVSSVPAAVNLADVAPDSSGIKNTLASSKPSMFDLSDWKSLSDYYNDTTGKLTGKGYLTLGAGALGLLSINTKSAIARADALNAQNNPYLPGSTYQNYIAASRGHASGGLLDIYPNRPPQREIVNDPTSSGIEPHVDPFTGQTQQMAGGGIAGHPRFLKGAGDGMSDSIPAQIDGKEPAALANEEFVVPADVVSHLGNGSSSAGANQLYSMMDRVRKARTGNEKQGKQINAQKMMPA